MKYFILIIVFITSCASVTSMPSGSSKIKVNINESKSIVKTDPKYFLTGSLSDLECVIGDNTIDNINPTDAVFFYKKQGVDKYFRGTNSLWIFDLSQNQNVTAHVYPQLGNGNIEQIPDELDVLVKLKTIRVVESSGNSSGVLLSRSNMDYNSNQYVHKGSTQLSYQVEFSTRPPHSPGNADIGLLLPLQVISTLEKTSEMPLITELIYVETYRPNFMVNDVQILNDSFHKSTNFDSLAWYFVKGDTNYLIIHFEMKGKPFGSIGNNSIAFIINGIYGRQ